MMLRRWLAKLIRIDSPEHFVSLSSRAEFPEDELLARRIKAARECLGTVDPRPVRFVEDQPTTFKQPPIDWDDYA
jgi:hypothetical protein